MAQADDLDAGMEEFVWRILRNVDTEPRLQLVQLLLNLQNHVGELVHAGVPVPIDTADVNVREIIVGTGLAGGNTHLGRRRLVVELNPQATQEFLRLVVGQTTLLQPFLVERIEVLVDMAGIHGIPAVELGDRPKVDEPIHLNRLPEVAGRMGRNPVAHGCNLLQLGLADRVSALGRHFLCQSRMALGQQNRRVARNRHRLQLLLLVRRLGVIDIIQGEDVLFDARLHVQEALPVHPAVHRRMARSALLHELGEHPGAVGFLPFLGHMVENALPLRLAFPVRNHLTFVGIDILLTDMVSLQFAGVQHMQVLHAVAGKFRERRYRLRPGAALAHDQFVRADINRLLRADFVEVLRAKHGD